MRELRGPSLALFVTLGLASAAGCGPGDVDDGDWLPTIPFDPEPSSSRLTRIPLGSSAAPQGYWEYLPPGYDTGNSYPLLVFLHGVGANGNGSNELDKVLTHGVLLLIDQGKWPNERPFVVLSPQHSGAGCPTADEIKAFLDFALATYSINPDRVYLTGLSCGATGAWQYLGEHLDSQIAAMVPIAGNGTPAWTAAGCELGRVPIWAFHGDQDSSIDVSGTIVPISNLQQSCDSVHGAHMVIYEGVGHNSWTMTYSLAAGHDIYDWMLGHVK